MYAANELILKKRDGGALSRAEIAAFVAVSKDHVLIQCASRGVSTQFRRRWR